MKKLIAALLLAVCSVATAAPDKVCKPEGTAIFEMKKTVKNAKGPTDDRAVYANGALTVEATDKDGKEALHIAGECLPQDKLDAVKAALKDAAWTVTTARIKCMAMSNDITTYTVNGKEVFAETLCSGKSLDKKSADALDKLKDMLKNTPVK